jgi:mevalonate kinase
MNEKKVFYAKILLFGEYTVIFNAEALSIPLKTYSAKLGFSANSAEKYILKSTNELRNYLDFYNNNIELQNAVLIDTERLNSDISKGLYLDSDIPQGWGLGSSAAFIAAIYFNYSINRINPDSLASAKKLKKIFSLMEAYFHGTSSGMDPLVTYMNKALLFSNDISEVELPKMTENTAFIINSGYPGHSREMIAYFLEKMHNESFRDLVLNELILANTKCISSLLHNSEEFFGALDTLSEFQFQHFKEMIPNEFTSVWKAGLESKSFYLKLCGSGGGGFILGFSRDLVNTKKILAEFGINPMFI